MSAKQAMDVDEDTTEKKKDSRPKRVQAMSGLLITCDAALKQFLTKLHNDQPYKFVIRDLDERHLFVSVTKFPPNYQNVNEWLEYEVTQWTKKWTYVDEEARCDD